MGVPGDLLDVILLALMLMFGVSGYRHGFIVGLLSLAGFIGGVALGGLIALAVTGPLTSSPSWRALLAILVVFVISVAGMLLASRLGVAMRLRLTGRGSVTQIDSVAGAVMNGLAVLIIVWVIAAFAGNASESAFSRQVKGSLVLSTLSRVMPPTGSLTASPTLRDLVDVGMYTRLFSALGPGASGLPPPNRAVLKSPAIRHDLPGIVMISGTIPSCTPGRKAAIEGSGFVIAPHYVLTNAHVVTGVTGQPMVRTQRGHSYPATIVLYQPRPDIAVLRVPGLDAPALSLGSPAPYGASAVVAGYPETDGKITFTLSAATVGARLSASTGLKGIAPVSRQVYTIRAPVQYGNSGSPLLAGNGTVYGVVFAKSATEPDTGYALTASEVEGYARAGEHDVRAVTTGTRAGC